MSHPGTKPSCQEVSILGSKTSNFFAKNFRYYFIDDITIHKLIGLSLLAVAAQLDLGMSKMVSFNYLNKRPWTTILWTAAKNIWSYCDPRYETHNLAGTGALWDPMLKGDSLISKNSCIIIWNFEPHSWCN